MNTKRSDKKNGLKGLILLVMIGVASAYWVGSQPKQKIDLSKSATEISADNPKEVVDFTLRDEKGRAVKLSDFKGKPVLLNFWAAWCPPCVDELPAFIKTAQWAAQNLGVVTLAVSSDPSWAPIDKLFKEKKFWRGTALPLTILLSSDAGVANSYGTNQYPETYFINRDFKIIRKFVGAQNWTSQEITTWITANSR